VTDNTDWEFPTDHESTDVMNLALVAWQRKYLAILGVTVGLIFGSLYYAQATPVYESNAEVLVIRKRPEAVSGNRLYTSQFEDYVSTHTVLIQSPMIIERSIVDSKLGSLETFSDVQGNLSDSIARRLSVDRGSNELGASADSILTLSFRGPVPQECAIVVQSVVDSYLQFLGEAYRDMGEDTISFISKASEVLKQDLQKQEKDYRIFRQDSPLMSYGPQEVNPRRERLAAIELQLSDLLLRRADLETQLAIVDKAKEDNTSRADLVQLAIVDKAKEDNTSRADLVALVSKLANENEANYGVRDPTLGMDRELFSLLQQQQEIRHNYGPNHPHVQSLQRRISATRNFFSLPDAAYLSRDASSVDNGKHVVSDPVQLYLDYLKHEHARIDTSENILNNLYQREHNAAKQLTTFELQNDQLVSKLARTQELYDGIVAQLRGASLVKDYGGFKARIIAPPRFGKKVSPVPLKVFSLSMFLGVMLGFGLVWVAEVTDKSFRTPEEIRRQLGYAVVGHIPKFKATNEAELAARTNGAMLAPELCSFHAPSSVECEAYRGVRTALYFSTRGQSHKVFQITSPSPGDGKSTLAANLSICIAQSSKRILLIDADLRKPRQHRLFDIPSQPGLTAVIGLGYELGDAIHESSVPNLWILPSGEIPPDPSEFITSQGFSDVIELVREKYDYVIVDTGPLLAISDPSAVAARMDGVLLAMRLSKNSRTQAKRVREIITDVGAQVMGVVVNKVATSKSYGYGQYVYTGYYGNDDN